MDTLTLTRPDDWHLHLRDGADMHAVLPDTARRFARAIVMPNLRPPVTTTELALAYRQRILAALPAGADFQPLMTLYLTDNTAPEEIARAKASGMVHGVKLYPAGATTNSDSGVTDILKCHAALEAMQEHDLPLLVHGEVTDPAGGRVRPRAGVHRQSAGAAAGPLPPPEGRVRTHHHPPGGGIRQGRARQCRRHHHRPSPAATAAMPCSPAASARTCSACRC